MDMSKYKSMFISETQEHLQSMNQGLVAIEADPAASEAIAEVFRNAHSIKGMAASMGYEPIRDLAHAMEDLMDDVREGARTPQPPLMDLLFQGLDNLEKMLQDVDQDRELKPALELTGRIRTFRGEEPPPPTPPISADPEPDPPDQNRSEEKIGPANPAARTTRVLSTDVEIDFEFDPRAQTKTTARSAPQPNPQPEPKPDPVKLQPGPPARSPENLEIAVPSTWSPAPAPVHPPAPKPQRTRALDLTAGEQDFAFETTAAAVRPEPDRGPPEAEPLTPSPDAPAEIKSLEPPPSAPPAAAEKLTVRVIFSPQTAAPGVRGLILFKRISEVGEVLDSRPSATEVKTGNFLSDPQGLAVEIDLCLEGPRDGLIAVVNSMADLQDFEIRDLGAPAPAAEGPAGPDDQTALADGESGPERTDTAYDPFAQIQSLPQTVRVKTTALDQFITALGEMILVKNELREVARRHPIRPLVDGLGKLETLVRDFNDQVMSIRMMPLSSVVQRLPRVVRDLARDEGKKVRLEVRGQDIEIDRAILEQLSDPLIHLLRNCVGHGIEPPEERARMGKGEEGQVVIDAYRARDLVQIEIRDDGRGIDPHQLRDTAVAKGLIGAEEASQLSDEAAYQLIFLPGFSTAKVVGMVSGRGVGMDAVKNGVENLGGYVTLMSQLGKGTTFTLHLPRTIAIVHVLLVRVGQELFAIPIAKILKTVEILPHQIRRSQGQSFFIERQELIPLKPLHRFLELPEPKPAGRDPIPALIVEVHKRKHALVVDELKGQEEAFIRPLGKPLERISGLSGVTMLGDGRLVFVLDTMSLM